MCGQRTGKGPVGRAAKMRRRTLLETIEIYTTPYQCLNSMIIRHGSRSYQQGEMRTGNALLSSDTMLPTQEVNLAVGNATPVRVTSGNW